MGFCFVLGELLCTRSMIPRRGPSDRPRGHFWLAREWSCRPLYFASCDTTRRSGRVTHSRLVCVALGWHRIVVLREWIFHQDLPCVRSDTWTEDGFDLCWYRVSSSLRSAVRVETQLASCLLDSSWMCVRPITASKVATLFQTVTGLWACDGDAVGSGTSRACSTPFV